MQLSLDVNRQMPMKKNWRKWKGDKVTHRYFLFILVLFACPRKEKSRQLVKLFYLNFFFLAGLCCQYCKLLFDKRIRKTRRLSLDPRKHIVGSKWSWQKNLVHVLCCWGPFGKCVVLCCVVGEFHLVEIDDAFLSIYDHFIVKSLDLVFDRRKVCSLWYVLTGTLGKREHALCQDFLPTLPNASAMRLG